MGGSQAEYPIEVVEESVHQLFAAGLGQFDEGFPETYAVSLALQDDTLQFLIDLSHHIHCYQGCAFILGS